MDSLWIYKFSELKLCLFFIILLSSCSETTDTELSNLTLKGYKNDVPYFINSETNEIFNYESDFKKVELTKNGDLVYLNDEIELFSNHDTLLISNKGGKTYITRLPEFIDLLFLDGQVYYTSKQYGSLKRIENDHILIDKLFYEEVWIRNNHTVYTDKFQNSYKKIMLYDKNTDRKFTLDSNRVFNLSYVSKDLRYWCVLSDNLENSIRLDSGKTTIPLEHKGFITWFEYKNALYYITQNNEVIEAEIQL